MPGLKTIQGPGAQKTLTKFQSFLLPKTDNFSKKDRLININVSGLTSKGDASSQGTAFFKSSKGSTSTT